MGDMKRYKITLSNRNIYREIEIDDSMERLCVGTGIGSDVRLRKDYFFDEIELVFTRSNDNWRLTCADNLFISEGDVKKLSTKILEHGKGLQINYKDSNAVAFDLEFVLDFDNGNVKYDRIIDLDGANRVTIGTLSTNDITINSAYTNKDRICLDSCDDGYSLNIENTTYGVFLNGRKASSGDVIKNKDFLEISDFFFYFNDGKIFTQISNSIRVNKFSYVDKPEPENYPKFRRNTRIRTIINEDPIEILDPPAKPQKSKSNIFVSLLPSLGMLVVAAVMFSFGVTMVIISAISAVMGISTSVIGIIESKKQFKETSASRLITYTKYIESKKTEIEKFRDDELKELQDTYIFPTEEIERVNTFSNSLFDRERSDDDFLCVNLGFGDVVSRRPIKYKKQERLEADDDLQLIPENICNDYKFVHMGPIICDLKNINALGIVGSFDKRMSMFRNIVIDIATRQHFEDVGMVFIANDENAEVIKSLRFLPHASVPYSDISNVGINDESRNAIFERLYKEVSEREQSDFTFNNIVVFLFDDCGFSDHPISRCIDRAKELGITFILFGETLSDVSQGCDRVVYLNDDSCLLADCHDKNNTSEFTFSNIDTAQLLSFVEMLAPVESQQISLEGTLTTNISLFEVLGILSVDDLDLEKNWTNSRVSESMAAPIGVSKSGLVNLDIHDKAHGPHGLVAGTTGSGKSEVLQTFILSIATLFHPYEVAFLIIDFKGGGMANQFRDLPHLLGAITNIDGKEINRSLKSIKAELQKRQRLFAEADVNHIDKYIEKYRNKEVEVALPHLIIIVDEFAELKAEQPDFMQELISTARIGRSLGVHLILATQKPAGQVNDQIWSNSRFKLCLKVQDKQDSNEVLKSPLAAEIKEAGRGYLQVGNNEIFELFQSAYSGAPERQSEAKDYSFDIFAFNDSGKKVKVYERRAAKRSGSVSTQLEAIVNHVATYCDKKQISKMPNICLPPLPEVINFPLYGSADNEELKYEVAVGIYDDPDNQIQKPYRVNLENTNLMILGSSQSGKTNLLQNIIKGLTTKCTPEEVNIYIIDFASMTLKNFEGLNHVGGVVCASDDEKLINLMKLLKAQISYRKEKLLECGASSFSAYRESGKTDLSLIVLMVDNLTALKELYFHDDDELIALCRDGLSYGISIVIANSQTSGIGYRYFSNFSTRIALYCNDSSEYNSLFDFCSERVDNFPGRALVEIDKEHYDCQTYLAFEGEKEVDRVDEIKKYVQERNSISEKMRAPLIPVIPNVLTREMLDRVLEGHVKTSTSVIAGLNYANVEPVVLDFASINSLNLCGKRIDVICDYIAYLISSINDRNSGHMNLYVLDGISKSLNGLKKESQHCEYSYFAEDAIRYITEIEAKLKKRYDAILAGDESVVEKSDLLLLVLNNIDAIQAICADSDALRAYKNITGRYKDLGVCLISVVENSTIQYSAPDILKDIKEEKSVMYFDNLSTLKLFDCSIQVMREFKKPIDVGDAFILKGDDCIKVKTVRG